MVLIKDERGVAEGTGKMGLVEAETAIYVVDPVRLTSVEYGRRIRKKADSTGGIESRPRTKNKRW